MTKLTEGKPSSMGDTRAAALRKVALGLGGLASGAAVAVGLAQAGQGATGSLTANDRKVLRFALELEQLQVHFYASALAAGKLDGETRQFAETVGGEERAHLEYLLHAVGTSGAPSSKYSFGDAATSNRKFVEAAVNLEDTGLAAYNGQAGNLSPAALASVARVISVEARHAAWVRELAGLQPAPTPVDAPITAAAATKAIQPYLASA